MFKRPLDIFGNDFGHFWNFENFLIFWKRFEDSTLHGTLGEKNFPDKLPQNMFKTRFRTFGEHFWAFLEFWNFFDFWKHFEDSTLHATLGKKTFRKNYPKTCSKHVWTLLGTILGILENLKFFWFFENISKTRPSIEHWANKIFQKSTPKHVQNTFGQFGYDFGRFWNFEFFLVFLKTFRRLEPPWNNEQKNFFEKITPKHVQNTFGHFGKDFGHFWIFEKFLIFLKTFRRLDPPWNTGQNIFFEKITPKLVHNMFGHFGNDFGHSWEFDFFWFFGNISKTRPSMEHWAKYFLSKKSPQNMFKTGLDILGTILGIFGFLKIF